MHSHDLLVKQLEGEAGLMLPLKVLTVPCSIFPLGTLFSLSESRLSQPIHALPFPSSRGMQCPDRARWV